MPEAVPAACGALLLTLAGLLPWRAAWAAVGEGLDVYLFLAGMMLLSELARREGVFAWCAGFALVHARGSASRLFLLVYTVGVVITVFLSNDATAVVLTPAVLAITRAARIERPLPYLLACALVANAASFVLPISNPANLVVFRGDLPPLFQWFRIFAIPSFVSVAATAAALYFRTRRDFRAPIVSVDHAAPLPSSGRFTLAGIALAIVVLLTASVHHWDLGAPTFAVALLVVVIVAFRDPVALWEVPASVSWSVLPLVAGLFVVIQAVNGAGALAGARASLHFLSSLPQFPASLMTAAGITLLSNVINNLPAGLITGTALLSMHLSGQLRSALLIGVDLGPNLSVTGSLATILWLIALRRENQGITFWSFLKVGLVVTPPALFLAILTLHLP